jgi:uncharacterized protein
VTPAYGDADEMSLDVVTPSGEMLSIDDPALMERLTEGVRGDHRLTLIRSDRALTDCRPVSLISSSTIRQIEAEVGIPLDPRRFRANVYFDFTTGDGGFAEDAFVGRRLRVGSQATMMVLERDPRCRVLSLDPETGEHNAEILRKVVQAHDNLAGVYCAVLVEGVLRKGDSIELLAG